MLWPRAEGGRADRDREMGGRRQRRQGEQYPSHIIPVESAYLLQCADPDCQLAVTAARLVMGTAAGIPGKVCGLVAQPQMKSSSTEISTARISSCCRPGTGECLVFGFNFVVCGKG